jgi:hypothetical protein
MGDAYGGFAGIVKAEEEEFGVLVGEAEGGQDIPDWRKPYGCLVIRSFAHLCPRRSAALIYRLQIVERMGCTYTSRRTPALCR